MSADRAEAADRHSRECQASGHSLWVQDEGETIVNLSDEFVGFGGNEGEGLEPGTIRPLPRVPNTGKGKCPRFDGSDGEDTLSGRG
jgi:hypothetical protein